MTLLYKTLGNVNTPSDRQIKSRALHGFMIALLSMSLSACSTTSETFDSTPTQGVGAKSISEVNQLVDQGRVGGHAAASPTSQVTAPVFVNVPPPGSDSGSTLGSNSEPILLSNKTLVYREKEKHLRVWLAPYQDIKGNLHEGAIVHVLTQGGFWRMQNHV